MGTNEKQDSATNEVISKALNELEDVIKGCKKGEDEKKEHEMEKKDVEKSAACKCGKEDCKGECKEEKHEKSFAEEAADNDTINKAMEVSPFLEEIVKSLGVHTDGLKAALNENREEQLKISTTISKALTEIATAVSNLSTRTTELEKTPEVKKSVTATAVGRDFAKSGEDEEAKKPSKAEVCNKIMDMVLNKSMIGGQEVSIQELSKFESTGQMRDALKKAVLS